MFKKKQKSHATPDPNASGWSGLYKTVRDADVDKVDDCRDDIDTLLVFAGLYSAVLTAFVIESYTHLQQDTQDVIVGLLQQLVAQNFTSGPGYMNSTSIPSTPPFEPPLWAIRVNVLWFTSLLLSLMSASFGILVKQWLHEYLAIEYAGPRERLRARQFRNPGLARWRVFEIAAMLPLLLQGALGLFFLGLCFFTSAIHSSIGRMTAPVVCAWLFLFIITIIAPLFSPRCPFKTTFLKSSLRAGRCYLRPCLVSPLPLIRQISQILVCWFAPAIRDILSTLSSVFYPLIRVSKLIFIDLLGPDWFTIVCSIHEAIDAWVWMVDDRALSAEEHHIIQFQQDDMEFLLLVDSSMSDDGLIPSMLEALQETGENFQKVVEFILRMTTRRIVRALDTKRTSWSVTLAGSFWWMGTYSIRVAGPNLDIFSAHAVSAMNDTIINALGQCDLARLNANSPRWIFGAILILLSHLPHFDVLEPIARVLREVVIIPTRTPDHHCTNDIPLYRLIPRLVSSTAPVTRNAQATDMCACCLRDAFMLLLCQDTTHSHSCLADLITTHAKTSSHFVTMVQGIMKDLRDLVLPPLGSTALLQNDWDDCAAPEDAWISLTRYFASDNWDNVITLYSELVAVHRIGALWTLVDLASIHRTPQRIPERVSAAFNSIFSLAQSQGMALSHITSALRILLEDPRTPGRWSLIDYVVLCEMTMFSDAFQQSADSEYWLTLSRAIKRFHEAEGWQMVSVAGCLPSDQVFKEDQAIAHRCLLKCTRDSGIPAELVHALWLFIPSGAEQLWHRLFDVHGFPPPPAAGGDPTISGSAGLAENSGEA